MCSSDLSSVRLRTARRTVLNALAEKLGETCNIALPDRDGMIYLDRVETKWPLRIQLPIGTKVPFHATASGKLYLSTLATSHRERLAISLTQETPQTANTHRDSTSLLTDLKRTRLRGYAEDNEEFMDGMVAVAVPILDQNKRLLSTLSVHAPSQRMSINDAREAVPELKRAAEQLEQLGHYHLNSILEQFEVVSLTYRARPQQERDLDQVREYVRVFDRIMQRGVDRGELSKDSPIGQLRDVFFGTLEFSARTLKLRERPYDHSVVTNLLAIMVGSSAASVTTKGKEPSNRDLMNTLKSIQKQLKSAGD